MANDTGGFNIQNLYNGQYNTYIDDFKARIYLQPIYTRISTRLEAGIGASTLLVPKPTIDDVVFIPSKANLGWTPDTNSGITFNDLELPITLMKNERAFNVNQLSGTYLQRMLSPNALKAVQSLPMEFMLIGLLQESASRAIDKIFFGNLVLQITSDSGSTQLHTNVASLLNSGNTIVDAVNAAYDNIPDQLKQLPGSILVSPKDYTFISRFLINQNLFHIDPNQNSWNDEVSIVYPYNTNYKIIASINIPVGKVIITPNFNLLSAFGGGDTELLNVWFKIDEQEIRTRTMLNLGSGVYFLEYLSTNF